MNTKLRRSPKTRGAGPRGDSRQLTLSPALPRASGHPAVPGEAPLVTASLSQGTSCTHEAGGGRLASEGEMHHQPDHELHAWSRRHRLSGSYADAAGLPQVGRRGPPLVCETRGDGRWCTPPRPLGLEDPSTPSRRLDVLSSGACPPSSAVFMDKRCCVNGLSRRAPLGHNNCGARPVPLLESHFSRGREERQSTGGKGLGVPLSAGEL